jgi:hypothetical protein
VKQAWISKLKKHILYTAICPPILKENSGQQLLPEVEIHISEK